MVADQVGGHVCFVCKKVGQRFWRCDICPRAGRTVIVCSARCRRVHERDDRHRSEKRKQRPPPG
jgi:hypothetical protein